MGKKKNKILELTQENESYVVALRQISMMRDVHGEDTVFDNNMTDLIKVNKMGEIADGALNRVQQLKDLRKHVNEMVK